MERRDFEQHATLFAGFETKASTRRGRRLAEETETRVAYTRATFEETSKKRSGTAMRWKDEKREDARALSHAGPTLLDGLRGFNVMRDSLTP